MAQVEASAFASDFEQVEKPELLCSWLELSQRGLVKYRDFFSREV